MTLVRVKCGSHDCTVAGPHVTVVTLGGHTWARFPCAQCRCVTLEPVGPRTALLLQHHGAATQNIEPPALETGFGDPVTITETRRVGRAIGALRHPADFLE